MRDLRERAGLQQAELAVKLNVARNTLSQYETGQRKIPDHIAKKMADIFGVSLDCIYGYTPAANVNAPQPDPLIAFYSETKKDLTQDDLDDIKTLMEFKVRRNREKQQG